MHYRTASYALLAMLLASLPRSSAIGAELSTAAHPLQSTLTLEFFLGDPTVDPNALKLATVGPGSLSGTVTVNTILDGAGDGSLEFVATNLVLGDLVGTIDLDLVGTVDYEILGLGINFANPPQPVTGNAFDFPYSNQTMLTVNQGTFLLDNPTGLIDVFLGPFVPFVVDFAATPFTANPNFVFGLPFEGTVDDGPGLFTPLAEINFDIPAVTTPLLLGVEPDIFLQLTGEIHVAVPEPSSWALFSIGGPILLCMMIIKRRRYERLYPAR